MIVILVNLEKLYLILSKLFVNVNIELDKNVNLEIGQFVPILFH